MQAVPMSDSSGPPSTSSLLRWTASKLGVPVPEVTVAVTPEQVEAWAASVTVGEFLGFDTESRPGVEAPAVMQIATEEAAVVPIKVVKRHATAVAVGRKV
eukprot:Polyplicarium_translucidae@DN1551_c0_g1_i2.p1